MEEIKKEIEEISEKDLEEVAGGMTPIRDKYNNICPKCGSGNFEKSGVSERHCKDCGYTGRASEWY